MIYILKAIPESLAPPGLKDRQAPKGHAVPRDPKGRKETKEIRATPVPLGPEARRALRVPGDPKGFGAILGLRETRDTWEFRVLKATPALWVL